MGTVTNASAAVQYSQPSLTPGGLTLTPGRLTFLRWPSTLWFRHLHAPGNVRCGLPQPVVMVGLFMNNSMWLWALKLR